MTDDTTALTTQQQEADHRRKQAILRAVGLDVVPAEQRELALAIANRYDLDLMLKHLVLIDGRPYITRDALLWVAHRSGHFDGIVATEPTIKEFPNLGQCWYSEVTVWRDDMNHPFTYGGRYPVQGQNRKYGPEMAIKVGECMALRRAFNVSAATVEERWEQERGDDDQIQEAPKSLSALVASRVAEVTGDPAPTEAATVAPQPPETPQFGHVDPEPQPEPDSPVVVPDVGALPDPLFPDEILAAEAEAEDAVYADIVPDSAFTEAMTKAGAPKPDKPGRKPVTAKPPSVPPVQIMPTMPAPPPIERAEPAATEQCPEMSPFTEGARCRLHAGHKGAHRSSPTESWGPKIVD